MAGLLLVSGCGSSPTRTTTKSTTSTAPRTVDTSFVESGIKQQLSVPGAEVTSVKCPSDVKSEVGATFKCSVTWSNGATGQVKVTQTTLNHYTYVPVSGSVQVPGTTVEKSLQQELATQGAPNAQVHCPETIIVKVGTTVTCDVSSAGGHATGTVTFTFSSEEGTVDPSSVKTG
ncbi:MAG: DUF4333 domain-containing protein [Solirubrobacteraceae bacterium]